VAYLNQGGEVVNLGCGVPELEDGLTELQGCGVPVFMPPVRLLLRFVVAVGLVLVLCTAVCQLFAGQPPFMRALREQSERSAKIFRPEQQNILKPLKKFGRYSVKELKRLRYSSNIIIKFSNNVSKLLQYVCVLHAQSESKL
jgi:hypothetical protein